MLVIFKINGKNGKNWIKNVCKISTLDKQTLITVGQQWFACCMFIGYAKYLMYIKNWLV